VSDLPPNRLKQKPAFSIPLLGLSLLILALPARADTLLVAVASNFTATAQRLENRFLYESGHTIRFSSASTGKLFAQIQNGAPFDILLAADAARPLLLAASGHGISDSRVTYAVGRLVLWSRDPRLTTPGCQAQLKEMGSNRLAIANPDTAPYGAAAKQTLEYLGVWHDVEPQLVVGQNIAQTLQFVASGNASLGFVALSQTGIAQLPEASCFWVVPPEFYDPIEQQAILLKHGEQKPAAREFLQFLRSDAAQAIIVSNGYWLTEQ